eukprot:TRINITY_DN39364_c0_g1_i1.p1 TRINITY_DN39364_c0_g1~~TRINITY_DN39364_c0_g1_i1.p1  ORF type:complete len:1484 (+),score=289.11 TRINITY_DN39364_c0_g1_i1:654-4454(+)
MDSHSRARQRGELFYKLELQGINQAGLLAYISLVFFRCGFNMVDCKVSSDPRDPTDPARGVFVLSTFSPVSQQKLRAYLDVPVWGEEKNYSPTVSAAEPPENDTPMADLDMPAACNEILGSLRPRIPSAGELSMPRSDSKDMGAGSFSNGVDVPRRRVRSDDGISQAGKSMRSSISSPSHRGESNSGSVSSMSEALAQNLTAAPKAPRRPRGQDGSGHTPSTRRSALTAESQSAPFMEAGGRGSSDAVTPVEGRKTSKRSISFPNGDYYSGTCATFDEGDRLHGHGTYSYSPGSHARYREYSGQWFEGRKNGDGVLLYQSGGVYVGQWSHNKRNGRGVLLEYTEAGTEALMPAWSYEGGWVEDEMSGFGVEETGLTFFFGDFAQGNPSGKGGVEVRLDSNMRVAGCEVLHGEERIPLLDALQTEMENFALEDQPGGAGSPGGLGERMRRRTASMEAIDEAARRRFSTDDAGPDEDAIRRASFRKAATAAAEPSSMAAIIVGSSPSSPSRERPQNLNYTSPNANGWASPGRGLTAMATTVSDAAAALIGAAVSSPSSPSKRFFAGTQHGHRRQSPIQAMASPSAYKSPWTAARQFASPGVRLSSQATCVLPPLPPEEPIQAVAVAAAATTTSLDPAEGGASEEGKHDLQSNRWRRHSRHGINGVNGGSGEEDLWQPTSATTSAGTSGSGGIAGWSASWMASPRLKPVTSEMTDEEGRDDDRPRSESDKVQEYEEEGNAEFQLQEEELDGETEFQLLEVETIPTPPHQQAPDSDRTGSAQKSSGLANLKSPALSGPADTCREAGTSVSATAQVDAISFPGVLCTPPSKASPRRGSANVSPARSKKSGSPEKDRGRGRRPVLCPMLWSEDEVAAFMVCLGLPRETAMRVRLRRLRGADELLRLSNAALEQEFGLSCPLACLVVRRALKRFLELDRWEQECRVQGRRLADMVDDHILRDFTIPLEELEVRDEIAQGGFGTVFEGVLRPKVERGRLEANKTYNVAVKDMKGDRRVRLHELLKEGRIMASLKHRNICGFVGICAGTQKKGSKQYILSELLDCSLFDLVHNPIKCRQISHRLPLSLPHTLRLFSQILAGLMYLHARKLVHADLKSSNVIIQNTNEALIPKICDFGHVAVRTHPAPHRQCGTPHWAAPEALRNEAVAPAADIYSIGVMLWEALAHQVPHAGLSFAQVLGAVGWAGWAPDEELLPDVPEELVHLLRHCWSFAPSQRPAAHEVRARLRLMVRSSRKEAMGMLLGFLGACGGSTGAR